MFCCMFHFTCDRSFKKPLIQSLTPSFIHLFIHSVVLFCDAVTLTAARPLQSRHGGLRWRHAVAVSWRQRWRHSADHRTDRGDWPSHDGWLPAVQVRCGQCQRAGLCTRLRRKPHCVRCILQGHHEDVNILSVSGRSRIFRLRFSSRLKHRWVFLFTGPLAGAKYCNQFVNNVHWICTGHHFSQVNDRIATKLAHDGIQVSLRPRCAQSQGQGQRSRDTGTFLLARKSLLEDYWDTWN